MYDNIEEYATEESVYPARYDTIIARVGYERVELDLLKAGRLPANKIKMSKATKTIVEVYGEDEPRVWDTLCSWVNITGLTQSKMYRIKVFSADEHGNMSLPQEIDVVPCTKVDLEALRVTEPRIIATPYSATLFWRDLLNQRITASTIMLYVSMKYNYTNMFTEMEGSTNGNIVDLVNLKDDDVASVDITYKVRPVFKGIAIIDTLEYSQSFSLRTPTADDYRKTLENRGIRSLHWSNSKEVQIKWNAYDNPTLYKTTITYKSSVTGLDREVEAMGGEVLSTLPEFKLGDNLTILSTYNPAGTEIYENVLEESIIDSKRFYPEHQSLTQDGAIHIPGLLVNCLEFERSKWEMLYTTSAHANDGFNSGNIPADQRPPLELAQYGHLDDEIRSFFGIAKAGQTGGGGDFRGSTGRPNQTNTAPNAVLPYWVVDLKEPINFNYVRLIHKTTDGAANNNPDGNASLWVWGFKIYGTNEYKGKLNNWSDRPSMDQGPGVTIYRDPETVWTEIDVEKRFPNAGDKQRMSKFPPIVDFSANTESYRFLKIEYTHWEVGGNNVLQVAEFYLGYKIE